MISPSELDRALAAQVAFKGRVNRRPVRCVLCADHFMPGWAFALWIDGHRRGFVCWIHARGVPTRRHAARKRNAA
jgi:hypothetical protein